MPRVATAGPIMPSNAHLPGISVRLSTTYGIHHFSGFMGEKAYPPTVADYVSAFETHYSYALATGQLMAVLHYLSPSYWIVQLSLNIRVCQNVPPGGAGVAPSRARKILDWLGSP